MSDELVERLRQPWFTHGCEQYQREAADRIEELEAALAALKASADEMAEALQLADATLRGANMNIKIVERKVTQALTAYRNLGGNDG